jgi:hypothetical protein
MWKALGKNVNTGDRKGLFRIIVKNLSHVKLICTQPKTNSSVNRVDSKGLINYPHTHTPNSSNIIYI